MFSLSREEEAGPRCDAQFADLLREGPTVGIHTLVWANTLSTLERTLDRQTIHEFDHRVLFQMSTADSSNLIDSPIANQLGLHRALLHSEEQGGMERFRPYAAIPDGWLAEAGRKLHTEICHVRANQSPSLADSTRTLAVFTRTTYNPAAVTRIPRYGETAMH